MDDVKVRASIHNQLGKLLDAAEKHNVASPNTAAIVSHLLERGQQLMEKAQEAQTRILQACKDDVAAAVQYNVMTTIEETYLNLRVKVYEIRATLATPATPSAPIQPTAPLRLPKMELPTFSGNYEDWPTFENLFASTIDKNTTLSGSQKLQYLMSSVRGEAAQTIKAFTITDANYGEAWSLLQQRYSNKREIVFTIINKLYNYPVIKNESAALIQPFYNTIMESVRQLKVLGRPVDKWDDMVNVLIINKLDRDTKAEWARSLTGTDPPTFKEVTNFLDRHIRSLIARGAVIGNVSNNAASSSNPKQGVNKTRVNQISSQQQQGQSCSLCEGAHHLYQCQQLMSTPEPERMGIVKKTTACLNCLRDGHQLKDCYSKSTCKHCGRRHHTLLHSTQINNQQPQHGQQQSANNKQQQPKRNHHINKFKSASEADSPEAEVVNINITKPLSNHNSTTILKTALAYTQDNFGNRRTCRILIDDGAEAGLINNDACNSLGLQRRHANILVSGIGGGEPIHVKSRVMVRLFSYVYERYIDVELLVSPCKITGKVPLNSYEKINQPHLHGIPLADPNYNQSSCVDILLGADCLGSILLAGLRKGTPGNPIAQHTIFGWTILGKTTSSSSRVMISHVTCTLESMVKRFWEIEDLPTKAMATTEEQRCEKHFQDTHKRLPDGRYQVRLPFNEKKLQLGGSKELALKRLYSLEKRFGRNPQHYDGYIKFMSEYLELGHMEEVPASRCNEADGYYIPHHYVIKEDSSTTKLRVVFDASMKSTSGVSLNDTLMVGPTIQDDLYTQLVKFRLNPVALKADIAKMYRQFVVHPEDRTYQRILWRDNPSKPVKEYFLNTVTYGTACAPYLATRCLQQLATDEEANFPAGARVLKENMYVDDLLHAESDPSSASHLVREIVQLVKTGGMDIRKWCSNSQTVLQSIPPAMQEAADHYSFDDDNIVKALGVSWIPQSDIFTFIVNNPQQQQITKRRLLGEISKTFDPMGLVSPVTVNAKILFQDLWRDKTDWDDTISQPLLDKWRNYSQQLQKLSALKISRCISITNARRHEIHAYCDSSEKCYATAIYLKCIEVSGHTTTNLITSKTRVAPLKQISLPRLELCGAVLLAETVSALLRCFPFKCEVYAWTDSMIVLHWLRSESRRWKTFVANRVAIIQNLLPAEHWRHVSTHDNPADLPSRGITPDDLLCSSLWWHGPAWLKGDMYPNSDCPVIQPFDVEEKTRIMICSSNNKQQFTIEDTLYQNSTLSKIISIVGWWRRFFTFIKDKKNTCKDPLTPLERKSAMLKLIFMCQQSMYQQEFRSIKSTGCVNRNSNIHKLNPFVDETGLLRIGGRLSNAAISEDRRHPYIIPDKHPLATLLVRHYHIMHLHGGVSLTLNSLRSKYWIVNGRNCTRQVIHKCVKCRRLKARPLSQQMGNLPSGRVTAHRPFLHCGVDLGGPFCVKMRRGRGSKGDKCWMAIFVCFSTKAVHLEMVTDLGTETFLECYKRFVARRGISSHMYSDCGTNFVGADRTLKQLFEERKMQNQMAKMGTTWCFNPPAAPHQGGLWEAAVKSVKYHLRRVMGDHLLTMEQFQTVLCNIEACLNSRPLCALTADPNDLDALTPGHFLVGHPLTAIPEPDTTQQPWNRLAYWQQAQQISQNFWKRWKEEYLSTLQPRGKWQDVKKNLSVGDLVVIHDELQPPTRWKMARVIATHAGADGLVRKVTLRTSTTEVIRPIQKLSILLFNDEM